MPSKMMPRYNGLHHVPLTGQYCNGTESFHEQDTTSVYRHGTFFARSSARAEETESMYRFYSPDSPPQDEMLYDHKPNQNQIRSQHSQRGYYPLPIQSHARAPRLERNVSRPSIDPDTADAAAALIALPNLVASSSFSNVTVETSTPRPRRAFYRVSDEDRHHPPPVVSPQSVITSEFQAPNYFRRLRSASSSESSVASDSSLEETNIASDGKNAHVCDEGEGTLTHSGKQDDNSLTTITTWFSGCTLLALPEDDDVLSPLHCFMRKYCVEAFSATSEDVALPRYGRGYGCKIQVGQVGIRCLHCRWRKPHDRAERAACYPSSIKNIYHSMETWQRRHSIVCDDIPGWVKKRLTELMKLSRSFAGGRRQYWTDAGMKLGLVDTKHGVRFSRDPATSTVSPSDRSKGYKRSLSCPSLKSTKPRRALVSEDDRSLVTKYLFLLIEQMQTCHFTEEDRTGGRSKVKDNMEIGFPGLECKHCTGKAGFGRYFPNTLDNLALANSDRNIYNHMIKCRRCPTEVKASLKQSHSKRCIEEGSKNRRGSRRKFFERIWNRLHRESSSPTLEGGSMQEI